jgi:hypothetical protein
MEGHGAMTHCGKLLKSGNTCKKLRNHKGRCRGTQHDMSKWIMKLSNGMAR